MQTRKPLFYGAALITILLWGTAYTLIGYIVDTISPAWLVAVRTSIAAVVLTIYALLRGHKFPNLRDERWRWYALMGLIGMALPFYFTAKGQTVIDSGLAAILSGVMPLFTIVLAHFFIKGEHLSPQKSLGFFIGFIGIVYLFLPVPFKWELITTWKSQGLILLTALCYAVLTIIAKRAPDTSASVGAAMMLMAAAAASVLFALGTGIPDTMPPASAITALLLLALGATGIAQILYLRIVQISGPSFVAKLVYLVPIISIITGILFLDEPFSWRSVIALVIVFAGLLIARAGETSKLSSRA